MSRTHRKYNTWSYRNPKTQAEIKQIKSLLQDYQNEEYSISGVNHLHHRLSVLPTANDDLVVSSYYETDYK